MAQNRTVEAAARWAVNARNLLKLEIRSQGPWLAARLADLRNLALYGIGRAPVLTSYCRGTVAGRKSLMQSRAATIKSIGC